MGWQHIQYQYPYPQLFEKELLWLDKNANIYFGIKLNSDDSWEYYAGDGSHALISGQKLTYYGTNEANAQTNYLTTSRDANGKVLAVLPKVIQAKYVRLYVETGNDVDIWEWISSTRVLANEIIGGQLEITDQLSDAPLITITASSVNRLKIGNIGGTKYGIEGFDGSSNTIFELSDNQTIIGGWSITNTTLHSGTDMVLDASGQMWMKNSSFGSPGIQLDGFASDARAYIGDGSSNYFQFDGTNLSWATPNSSMDTDGNFTINAGGDITLIGDNSSPGMIILDGDPNNIRIYASTSGAAFYILPDDDVTSCDFGGTGYRWTHWKTQTTGEIMLYLFQDSSNQSYIRIEDNDTIEMSVVDTSVEGSVRLFVDPVTGAYFAPPYGTVDLGTDTYPWNDIHGTDLYLDGNVGLGGAGAVSTVGVRRVDATLDTNAAFYALQLSTTKTAGASDQNDSYRTANLSFELDQSGGVFGASYGIVNTFILSDGDVGTVGAPKALLGIQNAVVQSDGLITGNAFGLYNINDYDGGTINGNSYGLYNRLDQESGHTIGGNVFGMFLYSAFDGTVTGNTYVIYSNEVSGVDFFIYQAGTATSRFGGTIDIVTTIDRTDHIKIENTGTVEHGYIGNDSSSLFLQSGVYYDGADWQFDDAGSLPAVIQIKGFDGTIDFRTLGSQGSPLNRMRIRENGVVLIGDVAGGDYTKVEADGTIEFSGDGTVWNDIQFPITAGKEPTSSAPTWTALTGTSFNGEYAFDINEYIDLASNELVHSWKEGTAGNFHAHISIPTANSSGASRYATVNLYVAYVNSSDVWTETLLSGDLEIPDGSVAGENFYLDLGDLTLTGLLIGTQIKCRVRRVATGAGTEYSSDIFIHQVGCHVEEDTVGSRTEASK